MRPLAPEEGVHFVDDDAHGLLRRQAPEARQQGLQAVGAELFVPGVARLGQTVGIGDQEIARLELQIAFQVGRPGHHPERDGRGHEALGRLRPQDEGRVVTGVDEAQRSARRPHLDIEQGHEAVVDPVAVQDVVHLRAEIAERRAPGDERPQRRLQLRRQQGGPQPLPRHVPQDDTQTTLRKLDVVDEIGADVVRRPHERPERPAVGLRVPARQEGELHLAGDLDLVARQKLVLQFEHQDEQDDEIGPDAQVGGEGDVPERQAGPAQEQHDQRGEQREPAPGR